MCECASFERIMLRIKCYCHYIYVSEDLFVKSLDSKLVVGGPGCGRGEQCKHLVDRYIGWVHLRVGDLLREEFTNSQDTKWSDIASMVHKGHLAPTVKKFY